MPQRRGWFWLVVICYGFSGLTSLSYEVLWARMLSLQFGVSIFGVVLTVAAFMFGLGLGSLASSSWFKHCRRPLRVFALLELAIAVYALVLPTLLHGVNAWMNATVADLSLLQWYLLQGLEALCLLVLPAFAMGLGFALILKTVAPIPASLGKIYGVNTLGGVLGALLPLWTLPLFGWDSSVKIIAALGLCVAAVALIASPQTEQMPAQESTGRVLPWRVLFIYAGIGACSIMLEVGWVRLYGMIMLRTEYVLGVILAVFLLGIALGSLLSPRKRNSWLSMLLPFAVGAGVLAGLWLLPLTSTWVAQGHSQTFFASMLWQALLLGVFTLPITLALGAWLPLLSGRVGNQEQAGLWLYGANCLGGGVGAVVACVIIIPNLGSTAMIALAGLGITALGLLWVAQRWVWLVLLVMVGVAWPLARMPQVKDLLPSVEANSRELYLYEDAVSLTHVVQHPDGQRVLLSDLQRMDASTEPSAVAIQMDQARLALLLHPEPHSILFLGLGTGISMAGSQPFPDLQRSVVELSTGSIIAAQELFSLSNGKVLQQAQIVHDDARHFLTATRKHYDVIVGDLFHPDLAGMGSLLSVQQFSRARSHLNERGIFVQWLALNQFDTQSLEVVFRSFRQIFPNAQLFMDGMHLALVGSNQNAISASAVLANLQRLSVEQQEAATGGEGAWTWLGRYWGAIPDSAGAVQDEWMPLIEFSLPRARYAGGVNPAMLMSWLLRHHPDAEVALKNLGIVDTLQRDRFRHAYMATEWAVRSWIASIQGNVSQSTRSLWLAYQANPADRWIVTALADTMLGTLDQALQHGLSERDALLRILKICPTHVGTLQALMRLEYRAGNVQAGELYRARLAAVSPLDSDAAGAH